MKDLVSFRLRARRKERHNEPAWSRQLSERFDQGIHGTLLAWSRGVARTSMVSRLRLPSVALTLLPPRLFPAVVCLMLRPECLGQREAPYRTMSYNREYFEGAGIKRAEARPRIATIQGISS
jgi:hypothetical protein